jgi:hypothetical protein
MATTQPITDVFIAKFGPQTILATIRNAKHPRVRVGTSDWQEVASFVTGNEREALAGWGSASPTATRTSAASSVQRMGRDIRCGSNTSFRG